MKRFKIRGRTGGKSTAVTNRLEISVTPEGVIITVSVKPKAKREGVQGIHNGMIKIGVTAAPEKGKANAAVVSILAKLFGLPKNRIELKTGAASRKKAFLVRDITTGEIADALGKAGINIAE